LGRPWPKNGPRWRRWRRRRRRRGRIRIRNINTRIKRMTMRGNIGFPNVLFLTMHLCL